MTIAEVSPGIYRIAVARARGVAHGELLTRQSGGGITVLPPSVQPDPEQEWRITRGKERGDIIIAIPSPIIPTSYLTYKGAPDEPKDNDRVEYHLAEFPPNEWHGSSTGYLYVARSNFGIKLGGEFINPPFLVLGYEDLIEWHFERVAYE